MKFPKIKEKAKKFHLDGFFRGIGTGNGSNNGVFLTSCENVWLKNNRLCSRPGIFTDLESIIADSEFRANENFRFYPLDITLTVEGEVKTVVAEEIKYDNATYFCFTHFLNGDGSVWGSPRMRFGRVDSDTFYVPDNIVFFKGKPIEGCGIYAFLHFVNEENLSQTDFAFYELNSSYTEWENTYSPYVPTVYINGRGNMYEQTLATGQVYLAEPKRLEKLNILNPMFYAYYSSDGYSSSFRLPFAELDDSEVTGRLYYSVTDYTEWVIPKGANSGNAKVYGDTITMQVNREKGIVSFSVPAGEYPMPLITDRNENNIRFSASKSAEWNGEDVTLAKSSILLNKKIVLAKDNILFEADSENPLYFPLESVLKLGEDDEEITALEWAFGKTVAFCRDKIYSVGIKNGKALNSTALLAENGSIFYENDELTATCRCKKIGCENKNSILEAGDLIYWQETGGDLYSINSSFDINAVSGNVSHILKELDSTEVFSFILEDYIIFAFNNKCLAMNKKTENWYFWELSGDGKLLCAVSRSLDPKMIYFNPEADVCYIARFMGERDMGFGGQYFEPQIEEHSFKSSFTTEKITMGCENTSKNVHLIGLRLKAKEAVLGVNGKAIKKVSGFGTEEKFRTVTCMPAAFSVAGVEISVESDSPLEVGGLDIKYIPLEW